MLNTIEKTLRQAKVRSFDISRQKLQSHNDTKILDQNKPNSENTRLNKPNLSKYMSSALKVLSSVLCLPNFSVNYKFQKIVTQKTKNQ